MRYYPVGRDEFGAAFSEARAEVALIREATSEWDPDSQGMHYLAGDGLSGYVLRPDGELVYVWSKARGRGDELVADAVRNGARYLDCFDGYLPTLYARHGFVVTNREPNWTPGGPDVVFMTLGV